MSKQTPNTDKENLQSMQRIVSIAHGIIIAPEDWILIDGQAADHNVHPAHVVSEFIRFTAGLVRTGNVMTKNTETKSKEEPSEQQ